MRVHLSQSWGQFHVSLLPGEALCGAKRRLAPPILIPTAALLLLALDSNFVECKAGMASEHCICKPCIIFAAPRLPCRASPCCHDNTGGGPAFNPLA